MEKIIDSEAIKADLDKSKRLSNSAIYLYYTNEPEISEATKAILGKFITMELKYIELAKLQCDIIDNLQAAYDKMKHCYDTERIKNTGSFNNN